MDVGRIQKDLQAIGLGGWLFYDFHLSNPIAYEVLGLSMAEPYRRRWFCWIPVSGSPMKILSAVEPHALETLPGTAVTYRTWSELHDGLRGLGLASTRVAMEYSPDNDIPYLSRVDAGTVDLIRSMGAQVVSSAPLAQALVSVLTPSEQDSHRAAGLQLTAAKDQLFDELSSGLVSGQPLDEFGVQQRFQQLMQESGLLVPEPPIVAVNDHAGNPHYSPTPHTSRSISTNDLVLLDFWARLPGPRSIYADYTWMAFAGRREDIPDRMRTVFDVAVTARDFGIALLRRSFESGQRVTGAEVDDHVRSVVAEEGFGDAFLHRTGHSITTDVHGNGAHVDNFETVDSRELLPNTCNSIEPGIYLADFGVRTETNTLLTDSGVEVTGGQLQTEITPLL